MSNTTLLIFFIVVLLGGCANKSHVLVEPQSGKAVECAASGWGWLGAPMAISMANECAKKYEAIGYVKSEQYLAEGGDPQKITFYAIPKAIFTSEPKGAKVYAADLDQKNFAEIKGTTPISLIGAAGTQFWKPECYKAVLNGKESEVICREASEISRLVHFKF